MTKRTLDELEHRLFRYHFILGADWKLCCRKLNVDRGTFFHAVYRIEQKLGRVFRELKPYPLYPLDEYFHGASCWPDSASEAWRQEQAAPNVVPIRPKIQLRKLRFPSPVKKAA
ncbi:MAG: hypothetical protein ABI823_10410 [Bryobacteraceae bacterium]